MTRVDAFSSLRKGLKALYPQLLSVLLLAFVLSAIGQLPVLIDRLHSVTRYAPPISLWGFFMSFLFWTAQTFILIGVAQVVWGHLKVISYKNVSLFPNKHMSQALFVWALSFTMLAFLLLIVSSYVVNAISMTGRPRGIPILPFVFYCFAFIPLIMVDRQVSIMPAIKQMRMNLKGNCVSLLKLAFIAEVVFLVLGTSSILLQQYLFTVFSIPDSAVVDQIIAVFTEVPISIVNSAMMAVAYAELFRLSATERVRGE
jgi:hypothetical protein